MKNTKKRMQRTMLIAVAVGLVFAMFGIGPVVATDYGTIEIGQDLTGLNIPWGTWTNETYGCSFQLCSMYSYTFISPCYDSKEVVAGIYTCGEDNLTVVHPRNKIIILANSTEISLDTYGHIYHAYYDADGKLSEDILIYRSDNPAILSPDSSTYEDYYGWRNLQTYGRSLGSATIYAELKSDLSVNASVKLSVVSGIPTNVCVYNTDARVYNNSELPLVIGNAVTLETQIYDQFGNWMNSAGKWSIDSGAENLTISQNSGTNYVTLFPVKTGMATLHLTSKTDSCLLFNITVNIVESGSEYSVAITTHTSALSINAVDGYAQAIVRSKDGSINYPNKRLNWSVDNESVIAVTVDSGYDYPTRHVTITPKSIGSAVLTASCADDSSVNTSVTITVDETVLTSVGMSDLSSIILTSSSSWNMWISAYDQHGRDIQDVPITITSSNQNILEVSDTYDGQYSGTTIVQSNNNCWIKPVNVGKVTITASSVDNPQIKHTCTVRVSESSPSYLRISDTPTGISNESTRTIWAWLYASNGHAIDGQDLKIEWSVADENVVTLSRSSGSSTNIIPNSSAIGQSTKIRAQYVDDHAIYDEFTITVAETIPTSVYLSGPTEITTCSSQRWVYAYVIDQFNQEISSENILWSVDNESVLTLEEEAVDSSNRNAKIIPHNIGTTMITAVSESYPSLIKSLSITVSESVPTYLYTDAPSGISLSGTGSLNIYIHDQTGHQINLTAFPQIFSVTIDNESILTATERTEYVWDYGKEYLLTPISKGVATVTVSCGSLIKELTIQVADGIPASIDAYWHGDDNTQQNYLLMNTYGRAYAYVYDQFGTSYGDTVRWTIDDPDVLDVSSIISTAGSQIALFPKSPGRTILHATASSNESVTMSFPIYVYAEVPTRFPTTVIRGENISISGESDAAKIQYYIFGTNYFDFGTINVIDGKYSHNITGTLAMNEGKYYALLQNPGIDGIFNITAEETSIYLTNEDGKSLVVDTKTSTGANAFEKLILAFDTGSIDDRYEDYGFTLVSSGNLWIDDFNHQIASRNNLTISGTVTGKSGSTVSINIYSSNHAKKLVFMDAIVDDKGKWSATLNTSGLSEGTYPIDINYGNSGYSSSISVVNNTQYLKIEAPDKVALSSSEYLYIYLYSKYGTTQSASGADAYLCGIDNESVIALEQLGTSYYQISPLQYGIVNVSFALKADPTYTATKQIIVGENNGVTAITNLTNYCTYSNGTRLSGLWMTNDNPASVWVNAFDSSGYSYNNERFTATSSNPKVIDVPSGELQYIQLTPKSVGEAAITITSVTNTSVNSTLSVYVTEPVLSIGVWGSYLTTDDAGNTCINITVGNTGSVYAYVKNQYQSNYNTPKGFTWNISNEDIVSIASKASSNSNEITLNPQGIGVTTMNIVSNDYPEVTKTVIIQITEPEFTGINMWGSNEVSLDGTGFLYVSAYDQYRYTIPEDQLTVTIINTSVVSMVSDPVNERYRLVPNSLGTTDIIAALKDQISNFQTYEITVVETIPSLRLYQENGDDLTKGSSSIVYGYVTDQYGYPVNYDLNWEVDKPTLVNITKIPVMDEWLSTEFTNQLGLRIEQNSSNVLQESTMVNITILNQTHQIFKTIQMMLSPASAKLNMVSFRTVDAEIGVVSSTLNRCNNLTITPGTNVTLNIIPYDQNYNFIFNSTVTIIPETSSLFTIESAESTLYSGCPAYKIATVKSGKETIAFTVAYEGTQYTLSIPVVSGNTEGEVTDIVEPPVISSSSDNNGLFTDSTTISIKTGTNLATIYYTLDGTDPTNESLVYSGPFTITESTTVKAFAARNNYKDSKVSSVVYTNVDNPPIYKVGINSVVGGNITAIPASGTLDSVPYGTIVTIVATPDDGYQFTRWSIIGVQTDTVKEKSPSVTSFTIDSEDVNISAVFTKIVDSTPKATFVKITNTPSIVYKTDTGVLNAVTYDQYGAKLSDNQVRWSSSADDVVTIDSASGAYEAIACGYTVITATSTEDPLVSTTYTMSVYQPPTPYINAQDAPTTAYYGVMSDGFNIDSTDTTYLNWDWDDGSSAVKMQVLKPYSTWSSSSDSVSHTFTKLGNLSVTLIPSNKYGAGATEMFPVSVTYAPPRNVKITDGPSSVVAGDTVTYTEFATGADGFTWYLDDVKQAGSTFSIPASFSGEHTVKVSAWKGTEDNNASATKMIYVATATGVLGGFGTTLTKTPEYSIVGDVSVFKIDPVDNATKYVWEFDGTLFTTTAPSIPYVLNDASLNEVTVTAYNSAETSSLTKKYTFTPAGYKPVISSLTASPGGSAMAGTAVTYTASASGPGTLSYKWVIDGKTVVGETASILTKTWSDLDVKRHEVAVFVRNGYGEERFPITYTVTPRANLPAVIESISGPSELPDGYEGTYTAVITSADQYVCNWYIDGVLQNGETESTITTKFMSGSRTLKLIVITSAEESTEMTKTITVIDREDWEEQHSSKDIAKELPAERNQVVLSLDDGGDENSSVVYTIGSIKLGKGDLREDAQYVNVSIKPLSTNNLSGFTCDMGSPSDVLMQLSVDPAGLKNEKDLKEAALLTFRIAKSSVSNPKSVKFYRLDTGAETGIDNWVELSIERYESEDNYWVFTVKTSGFSDFVAVDAAYSEQVTQTPTSVSSSGSLKQTGYTQIIMEGTSAPTPTPTAVPIPGPATPSASVTSQASQPTQSSPVPVFGLLAGFGVVGFVFMSNRRK